MGMTQSVVVTSGAVQRKAVWGPKRTLVALVLIAFGMSATAMAAGNDSSNERDAAPTKPRHSRPAPHAKPGLPSANVKNYKLDDEITRRRALVPIERMLAIGR